jgi:hypothetical protein
MAASTLPAPGTELGPCIPTCEHSDCLGIRKMAEEKCTICGHIIGYDVRYHSDESDNTKLCHALCLAIKLEGHRESRD